MPERRVEEWRHRATSRRGIKGRGWVVPIVNVDVYENRKSLAFAENLVKFSAEGIKNFFHMRNRRNVYRISCNVALFLLGVLVYI